MVKLTTPTPLLLLHWPCHPAQNALLRIFAGPLVGSDIVLAALKEHQGAHKARLDTYLAIEQRYFPDPSNIPAEELYRYITLRRGITHEKAWLEWCREALKRIAAGRNG